MSDKVRQVGAVAWGVARLAPVGESEFGRFASWLDAGSHGSMHYMERYTDIRRDPRLLLPGAKSIIVLAFSYYHADQFEGNLRRIAAYAQGDDYHDIVRERLNRLAGMVKAETGATDASGQFRICVDTAPLLERYWAVKAGVGFIGRNRMLIVPGYGSYVVLGSIITTLDLEPTGECSRSCDGCNRCLDACPTRALYGDTKSCLSYLTIEYRGDFPDDTDLHDRLYGCDICQRVCPHNVGVPPTCIEGFGPRPALRTLTPGDVLHLTQDDFSTIMRHSAIKRTKLAGLQRNALRLLTGKK